MLPGWDKLQDLRGKRPDEVQKAIQTETELRAAAVRTDRVIEASIRLDAVLIDGIKEGRRVSKLGAIAERIAAKKEAHDKKADEWASRLDALDQREPGAFAIGDAVIEEREMDLSDMERNMRKLSNLPNAFGKS